MIVRKAQSPGRSLHSPVRRGALGTEALDELLLLLADLSGLREVSVALFGYMRALIAAQRHLEAQIGMAIEVEKLLCRRFGVVPIEIESWKRSMGQLWQTGRQPVLWSLRALLTDLFQWLRRVDPAPPLRPELDLVEQGVLGSARLYQGLDNRGKVRIAFQIEPRGQARLRSYNLKTGSWRTLRFPLETPEGPSRAVALSTLSHTATFCGWQCVSEQHEPPAPPG